MAGLLFLSAVVGYSAADSNKPANQTAPPSTTTTPDPAPAVTTLASRTPIDGMRTAAFTITPPGSPPESHCGMLADTADQRAKGLMGERDLRGYDAMLFVFPDDVTAQFYMANVQFPLSVAWFDGAGNFVSSADMDLCADAKNCPRFGPSSPYRYALETAKGGLGALDVGSGSALAIAPGGSCA